MVKSRNIGQIKLATQYPIRIGARDGDERRFAGKISCLQIYDKALDEQQIGNLKSCPVKGMEWIFLKMLCCFSRTVKIASYLSFVKPKLREEQQASGRPMRAKMTKTKNQWGDNVDPASFKVKRGHQFRHWSKFCSWLASVKVERVLSLKPKQFWITFDNKLKNALIRQFLILWLPQSD